MGVGMGCMHRGINVGGCACCLQVAPHINTPRPPSPGFCVRPPAPQLNNILLCDASPSAAIQLADWGYAAFAAPGCRSKHHLAGTVHYIAPVNRGTEVRASHADTRRPLLGPCSPRASGW